MVFPFIERESSEIDPRIPAHLLVNVDLRAPALMINRVVCVRDAVGQGCVRHIHSIVSLTWDAGRPSRGWEARMSFYGDYLSSCAQAKGENAVVNQALRARKADRVGHSLPLRVSGISFCIRPSQIPVIIINNRLAKLHISFPRTINYSSRFLKHRKQEWVNERLRKDIFSRTIDIGPLPLPSIVFIIASVARPYH